MARPLALIGAKGPAVFDSGYTEIFRVTGLADAWWSHGMLMVEFHDRFHVRVGTASLGIGIAGMTSEGQVFESCRHSVWTLNHTSPEWRRCAATAASGGLVMGPRGAGAAAGSLRHGALWDKFSPRTNLHRGPADKTLQEGLFLMKNNGDPQSGVEEVRGVNRQNPYSGWARKIRVDVGLRLLPGRRL